MTYAEAHEKALTGETIWIPSWGECRVVRPATEGDVDFINYPIEGILVDACEKRSCDCKVIIYQPTAQEQLSTDWEVKQR